MTVASTNFYPRNWLSGRTVEEIFESYDHHFRHLFQPKAVRYIVLSHGLGLAAKLALLSVLGRAKNPLGLPMRETLEEARREHRQRKNDTTPSHFEQQVDRHLVVALEIFELCAATKARQIALLQSALLAQELDIDCDPRLMTGSLNACAAFGTHIGEEVRRNLDYYASGSWKNDDFQDLLSLQCKSEQHLRKMASPSIDKCIARVQREEGWMITQLPDAETPRDLGPSKPSTKSLPSGSSASSNHGASSVNETPSPPTDEAAEPTRPEARSGDESLAPPTVTDESSAPVSLSSEDNTGPHMSAAAPAPARPRPPHEARPTRPTTRTPAVQMDTEVSIEEVLRQNTSTDPEHLTRRKARMVTLPPIPPHPNTTFDEQRFLELLKSSISLTLDEKDRVIKGIPQMSQFQIDELTKIFTEEVEKMSQLDAKYESDKRALENAQEQRQREEDQKRELELELFGTSFFEDED